MDDYYEIDESYDADLDLSEIEGNDIARARFIKEYMKAKI